MSKVQDQKQHLHAIGIGGIGVSALARHFLRRGWTVSGCDVSGNASVEGATVVKGHDPEHCLTFAPKVIVYSPALPENHPELIRARELKIPTYSYPQALGLLAKKYDTIAVSGTHGKSTTTALLSQMFAEGKQDPVAIVGARVPAQGFEENYRHGEGKNFIVEGCEYKRGMLEIRPTSAVITNIEADHLDYYKDLRDIADAFAEYVRLLPKDGVLVYNADDKESENISHFTKAKRASFGMKNGDLRAGHVQISPRGMTAVILFHGKELGTIATPLSGEFNLMNILAAMALALAYGIPFPDIARAVARFEGIGRRFELIGALAETPVYSDYAHHPTALRVLSEAVEAKFGVGNTLIVFQPHQIDRTKKLRTEFEEVFHTIPHLALIEIYFVPGREHAGTFSAKALADVASEDKAEAVRFFPSFADIQSSLLCDAQKYKAIVIAGAGDIDKYARAFLSSQHTL